MDDLDKLLGTENPTPEDFERVTDMLSRMYLALEMPALTLQCGQLVIYDPSEKENVSTQ